MVKIISKYRFNFSLLFWFIFSTLTFIFFPGYNSFASTQVTLEWSLNDEPDLAGYRIFCREEGQSFDYTTPSWEGIVNSCTIYDLDETKTYYFVARAFDTEGFESGDSAVVILEAGTTQNNQPPIANAGPDQTVDEGKLVTLDGSNSTDPDDGIASYHWVQTGGVTVNLLDSYAQRPTFAVPDVSTEGECLTFELTVADHSGLASTNSCVVNVTWLNEPPQADAGIDRTVDEGVVVTLDGSASLDIDDGIASYSWSQTSGPTVTISNPALSQPTFKAPNVGPEGTSLAFNITVEDTGGLKDTDSCIVNVSWQNASPVAVIAEEYIEAREETTVTMDGSESTDPDDGIASYRWEQVDGNPATLFDSTSAVTTFTVPKTDQDGSNLTFKLTVRDSGGLQSSANCFVYVMQNEPPASTTSIKPISTNNPPSAVFNVVTSRKVASFTDNSSDTDGTIASWFWSFGDGRTSTEQNPKHRYVKFRNYSVTLTVTDDKGTSNSTSKNITITK